jgi:hypothetical protein
VGYTSSYGTTVPRSYLRVPAFVCILDGVVGQVFKQTDKIEAMDATYPVGYYNEQDLARAYMEGYYASGELEVQVYCPKCWQVVKTSRGLRVYMQAPPRMCQHCESLLNISVQRVAP